MQSVASSKNGEGRYLSENRKFSKDFLNVSLKLRLLEQICFYILRLEKNFKR